MDFAPNTIEDPTFCGIAVGFGERCRIHHIEPTKCVAFEGINTGRRFYMCSVQNVSFFLHMSTRFFIFSVKSTYL